MADEQTLDQLLEAIRVTADNQNIDWAEPPQPLTGGFWADLWRVRLTGAPELSGELVARVMPDPEVASREAVVQAHAANEGFSTPKVRLWSEPGKQLDATWILMDFAVGEPIIPNLSGIKTLVQLPRLTRSLPDTLARCTADLHQIPTAGLIEQLGAENTVDAFLAKMLDGAIEMGNDELARLADSLVKTRPSSIKPVVCHGDLHPFNVLTGPNGYVALDWSTAQLSDRHHDLAFTYLLLNNPPLSAPAPLAPIIRVAGSWLGKRFIKSYERFSETKIDEELFDWFTRLSALRVVIEMAWFRYAGELDSHKEHPFLILEPQLQKRYLGVDESNQV